MGNQYSDIIKLTNVGQFVGGKYRPRTEVVYKNKVYGTMKSFLNKHEITEFMYSKVKKCGFSREVSLLFFLGELKRIDAELDASVFDALMKSRRRHKNE